MPNPYEGDPRCVALYRNLPQLAGDNLRQVTLHAGEFGDDINCSLAIRPVDCEYEALSYTWQLDGQPSIYQIMDEQGSNDGDEVAYNLQGAITRNTDRIELSKSVKTATTGRTKEVETTIIVNQLEIPVMPNLAQALRYLREPSQDLILWIDYLCIDQNSQTDRTTQVRRMDEIYRRAKRVIVWLGLEAPDDQIAFQELKILAKGHHIDQLYPRLNAKQIHKRHEPLLKLFERGYWCRLWTVQETVLAREVVVRAGRLEMPWEIFVKARDTIRRHRDCCESFLWNVDIASTTRRIGVIEDAVLDLSDSWYGHLTGVMFTARGRTASDPRDRVFSLLGILSYLNRPMMDKPINPVATVTDIQADYSLSERDVFEIVTLEAIRRSNSLDVLVHSGDFSGRAGFPSWVCDMKFNHEDGVLFNLKYNAAHQIGPNIRHCSKDNLRAVGIPFETVASVGPALRRLADSRSFDSVKATLDAVKAWEEMHEGSTKTPYGSTEAWDDAFWQTLFLGQCPEKSRRVHSRDRTYYQSWRRWLEVAGRSPLSYKFGQVLDGADVRVRQLFITREKKSFFTTGAGYYGMAYPSARRGDTVCVLAGAKCPMLLRQLDETCDVCEQPCFRIVGFAYVHGIMDSEVIIDHRRGIFTSTAFCLK